MADNRKNTRNPESKLFRQLTRLFSGPIINHRNQAPRQLRRRQLDNYRFRSASGQNFKKANTSPYDQLTANYFATLTLRIHLYLEF